MTEKEIPILYNRKEECCGCTACLAICPKEAIRCTCNHQPDVKLITRKAIVASEEELKINKRSHSAKLRIVEKVKEVSGSGVILTSRRSSLGDSSFVGRVLVTDTNFKDEFVVFRYQPYIEMPAAQQADEN